MPENEEEKRVPILSRLRAPEGAVRPKRRRGRGPGSGLGKTSGQGQKGQKSRGPGNFSKLGFEGGQMPLQRRIPKRGFNNPFTKTVAIVNVSSLGRFDAGSTVDVDALVASGLIKGAFDGIKVLGNGDIDRALTVKAHAFSASAKAKIEKAGGTVEILPAKVVTKVEGASAS